MRTTSYISILELLTATAKHIKQKDIEAFYKFSNDKFVIVLSNSDLKESYPKELNFQERISEYTVNFRVLHNPPGQRNSKDQNELGSRRDLNTLCVTIFLPTIISDTAV